MINQKQRVQKKMHLGRLKGCASRNNTITYGLYALQALTSGYVTIEQLGACKKTILKQTKRDAKIWIKVYPDKSITARAKESRMGSGKGEIKYWVAPIKYGNVLIEITTTYPQDSINALKAAAYKLPIKTKIIEKIKTLII